MANYLALDISLNSTGYAILADDRSLVSFGYIEYPKLTEHSKSYQYHEKTVLQISKILELILAYEVSEVFLERFSFGSFGSSNAVSVLAEVTGCIKLELYKRSIPYHPISPQTVKKFVTGSGRAKKEDLYDVLLIRYPEIKNCRMDVSDAIGVGLTGLEVPL